MMLGRKKQSVRHEGRLSCAGVKPVGPSTCLIVTPFSHISRKMSMANNRARLVVAALTACVGGLIVASGFNSTKLGFAQTRPAAAVVQPIAEASDAFVAIANNVTPAVVSIEVVSTPKSSNSTTRRRIQVPQGVTP